MLLACSLPDSQLGMSSRPQALWHQMTVLPSPRAFKEGYGHVMFLHLPELIQPVSIGPGISGKGTDGIPLRPCPYAYDLKPERFRFLGNA